MGTQTTVAQNEQRAQSRRVATLVAHTHWDRAWYLPFQQFRMRLVRLIDRLLDILESDPDFRCFMLDGQMVVVEDYLEVRPERRADLERLVRGGRLLVGPWYVLPDEFLVSPESFIRNLEIGMCMAADFGGAMRVGYEPDAFGHIGQLPQILAGFGIDNAVLWRGLGDEARQLGSEFWWVAPDGTRALTIFLPEGYGPFSFLGYPHRGDEANMPFRLDWAIGHLERGLETLTPFANTPCLLLMAGIDHAEANRHLPEIVREAERRLPGIDIRIGSLPEHLDCVRSSGETFREHRGELRSGGMAFVLQQVYSTRMHLKQRNNTCQTLLERYAEPLTACAELMGASSQGAFLDLAWRELLKNHPHDDICGCSVDPVHREMEVRFDRVEQVGDVLVRDALRYLADRIKLPESTDIPLCAFNPNGRPYRGTLVTSLRLPIARGDRPYSIRDESGAVLPHQEMGRRTAVDMEVNRPRPTVFVDVAVALPEVPACGYQALSLGEPGEQPPTDLHTSGNTMRNDHLEVAVLQDGTLRVVDRSTGTTFEGLHAIEDVADAGDEYTFSPAPDGQTVTNADARVEIEQLSTGPVRAGYRIHHTLALPLRLAPDRRRRSDETVEYHITTDVWLHAGERRLEFATRVDNNALDHRLRVLFPTPIETETVHVDGHFDVVARPVALPEGRGWTEPPSPTAHQRCFVDVSDGRRGLAVFNRGLPEYEALRNDRGTGIALTLLRCVGWLSRGDLSTRPGPAGYAIETPEAQCLRPYEFQYALAPHAGTWEAIIHDAYAFNAPCVLTGARTTEGLLPEDVHAISPDPLFPAGGVWDALPRDAALDVLPPHGSFAALEPSQLVLSSLRTARDGRGLIVRCFNPAERPVTGHLRLLWPVRQAALVNFVEHDERPLELHDGEVVFEAEAKRIITIRCETV